MKGMMLFSGKTGKTIFSRYLNLLHVKFTPDFADKFFNEHPHKYNLYGLSKMLSEYNVPNAGIKITDKNELSALEVPFIAHFPDSFVLVKKILPDTVHFISEGREIISKTDQFKQLWSGIVLLAEPDENSIEPEYRKHGFQYLFNVVLKGIFIVCLALLLAIAFYRNQSFLTPGHYFLAGVNIIGLYVSYLLVLKQIHIRSRYADKLCSLLKHNDCNNVLESEAAKLWGIIGWSEVGLGYFISNLLIVLLAPSLLPYSAVLNICALPYTLWSVWYQKFKAGQWCVLCLIIQVVLWVQFFINYFFNFIYIPSIISIDTFFAFSIFALPFILINISMPYVLKGNKAEHIRQELNSIKMKEEVFLTLLKEQGKFEVKGFASKIIFGNPDATLTITVLTNPHCNPCAKMHKRINQLLGKTGNSFRVEYIFSSFGEQYDASGKHLIGLYLDSPGTADLLFNEWFETGRKNRERFFEKYPVDLSRRDITEEYDLHKRWKSETKLTATPTVLINGYKLPPDYMPEDLAYFTDIQIQ